MLNIFISYSKHDKCFLLDDSNESPAEFLRIMYGLEAGKAKIDFDHEFVVAGDHWHDKILDKLEKCKILVPILSDDFVQSSFCNDVEVKEILQRKNAGQDILITPFYFRYCEWRKLPWIEERGIRPNGDKPLQSIGDAHLRTRAMINFRAEIEAQAAILTGETQ